MVLQRDVDAWMRAGERKQRRWAIAGAIAIGAVVLIVIVAASGEEVQAGFRGGGLGKRRGHVAGRASWLDELQLIGGYMDRIDDVLRTSPSRPARTSRAPRG